MHYVRLLRRPVLDVQDRNDASLSLLISITTDLGDAFLDDAVQLDITYSRESPGPGSTICVVGAGEQLKPKSGRPISWESKSRVLKVKVPFPKPALKGRTVVDVTASRHSPFLSAGDLEVLPAMLAKARGKACGCIIPLRMEIQDGVPAEVSIRPFRFMGLAGSDQIIQIEEDIGESIARHIWDAGVVMASLLADACSHDISKLLPLTSNDANVLEIGSGVGILGLSIGTLLFRAGIKQGRELKEAYVLLTDLPEAEERAMSNISRYNELHAGRHPKAKVDFEALDWDDAKYGKFGPIARSRFWDYIVLSDCTYNVDSLPSLVGALTALHENNRQHSLEGLKQARSRVLLATKPRHDSEQALFGLLEADGWTHMLLECIELDDMGWKEEAVELYLLQKGQEVVPDPDCRKRKRTSPIDSKAKRAEIDLVHV